MARGLTRLTLISRAYYVRRLKGSHDAHSLELDLPHTCFCGKPDIDIDISDALTAENPPQLCQASDNMDTDVRSVREIEMEARLRLVQTGTLEAVQQNGELLQVLAHSSLKRPLTSAETRRIERGVERQRFNGIRLGDRSRTSQK